jgi:phosphoribosylformylglycinamidine synthase subunit PurL
MSDTVESTLVTLETAQKLGLLPEEYEKILAILGREPNFDEVSIFSVMWSEHCSYKNSITWLKTLPKDGSSILVEAGEENAGLVGIGDGLACAFKIESHNHPSAIEPYQGAATGVGGINRDIFTMGARPIAQLNSLRFGNIDNPRTKWLVKGVVKGIGDYGNAFGIPTVGGEVFFDDSYQVNILVNAMSVGIVKVDETISATSYGVGNPVFIVGSATGKDGIHGATFASGDLHDDSHEDLPAVQVGDPFQEKLLLEATLELQKTDTIIGMQDMGAAGIICSTSEMSAKGKHGMVINLDKVPTRQKNMESWEILLSESQERMLVVGKKGSEEQILKVFEKWDLNCTQIGEVTEGDQLKFYMHNNLVADVPAEVLVLGGGAPVYKREYREPTYFKELQKFDPGTIAVPSDLKGISHRLAANPNIASKKWVYNQYDSMVGTITMTTNRPSDAGVVSVRGTNKAIAMTVDCNSRYVYADPFKGCSIAVAEAARNIVCSGGVPSAVTNCLNFGNPYNPEVYWQFVMAIKGMTEACLKFDTPVTGGNVSFYNQSVIEGKEVPVLPTPTIGMIGIMESKDNLMSLDFKNENDHIFLIGKSSDDIACSEYIYSIHNNKNTPAPYFDIDEEFDMQQLVANLIGEKLVASAHDVSEGGIFIALLESAMVSSIGCSITTNSDMRKDGWLFGEAQGRVIVSVSDENLNEFIEMAAASGVDFSKIGETGGDKMTIDDENYGTVEEYRAEYENAIPQKLSNE